MAAEERQNRTYLFQKYAGRADDYIREGIANGYTAFGMITGKISQDSTVALNLLELGGGSIVDVTGALKFEEHVCRILFRDLSAEQQIEFTHSLVWRSGGWQEVKEKAEIWQGLNRDALDIDKAFDLNRDRIRRRILAIDPTAQLDF